MFNIKNYFDKKAKQDYKKAIEESYNVIAYNDEFWITYRGVPVFPCSMFKNAPIDVIKQIREIKLKLYNHAY